MLPWDAKPCADQRHGREPAHDLLKLPADDRAEIAIALWKSLTDAERDGAFELTKLLEVFEALPQHERSELVTELARRVALAPHDAPSSDDLTAAADRLCIELDRREQP